MAKASVEVKIADLPEFLAFMERLEDFIQEYAWHTDCASMDVDNESTGRPCDCGYDEALAQLFTGVRG